jgi:integrase
MTEAKYKNLFPDGKYSSLCLDFIAFVRNLGQKFEGSDIYQLRDICKRLDCDTNASPSFSKETVIEIAQRRDGETQGTQLNRIRVLRKLAKYMVSTGQDAYIIPKHFTMGYKYDFKPFIFSKEQIQRVFYAADTMNRHSTSPFAHLVIPAAIRVLFCCGLRSSEVRLLKANQADLENGIILIEKSKKNISRYVPISESLCNYLGRYAGDMGFDMKSDVYFFPSPGGSFYHDTTFRDRFRVILTEAGIPALGSGQLPRVHDARHSFVVHSFKKLTSEMEQDIYTALPIVAAYIGHSNLKDTERYIHLPAFDYSGVTMAGMDIIDNCVPEVIFGA